MADEDNNDGDCSLREAILAAATDAPRDNCPAGSGYDYIVVPAGTYYLASTIDLTGDMSIIGVGAPWTVIDGLGAVRILNRTGPAAELTLKDLALRHGASDTSGGCYSQAGNYTTTFVSVRLEDCSSVNYGGAIYNSGDLTIEDSLLARNTATGPTSTGSVSGGAIYSHSGSLTVLRTRFEDNSVTEHSPANGAAAIHACCELTVIDSRFSGNDGQDAGAIKAFGTIVVRGSLFLGNSAVYRAGALLIGDATSTLELENSTLSANYPTALYNYGDAIVANSTIVNTYTGIVGNTLSNFGTLTLKGSILFQETGDNCYTSVTSAGYNIENKDSCGLTGPGDLVNTDPLIAPLADNGGPTNTHKPMSGSPAIDAGNPAGCTDTNGAPLLVDQRGMPRPVDGDLNGNARCDIGAVERELNHVLLPLVVR